MPEQGGRTEDRYSNKTSLRSATWWRGRGTERSAAGSEHGPGRAGRLPVAAHGLRGRTIRLRGRTCRLYQELFADHPLADPAGTDSALPTRNYGGRPNELLLPPPPTGHLPIRLLGMGVKAALDRKTPGMSRALLDQAEAGGRRESGRGWTRVAGIVTARNGSGREVTALPSKAAGLGAGAPGAGGYWENGEVAT